MTDKATAQRLALKPTETPGAEDAVLKAIHLTKTVTSAEGDLTILKDVNLDISAGEAAATDFLRFSRPELGDIVSVEVHVPGTRDRSDDN